MPVLPPATPVRAPVRPAAVDLRVLRAAVFATLGVVLSGAGHVLASGCPVPVAALLVGWVGVGAFALAQGGRERSLRAICGGLTGAEAALHTLFHLWPAHGTSTGPSTPAGPPMGGMRMPGMRMPAPPPPHLAAAAPHLALWTHPVLLGLSPAMATAHLAAALAAGWWLRRGEAAIWRLVRLARLARLLRRSARAAAAFVQQAVLRTALPSGPWRAAAPASAWIARLDRDGGGRELRATPRLRHSVIRRGPPAAVFPA
ncbi:hypothetical protein ACFZB9_23395 [Kitasatospora sp. NPDC008050]|uniref:hypothetical protein n=1 Tax=Kitasatospora sp. NPDC008050 TaxID=3364021 RepID=UPI0036F0CB44